MKKSSNTIGTQTRDLPVCSAVPQPLRYRVSQPMGIPIQNTYIYSLSVTDDRVLLAQGCDGMEYMARKLKKEY
jgi:hypothetical protein